MHGHPLKFICQITEDSKFTPVKILQKDIRIKDTKQIKQDAYIVEFRYLPDPMERCIQVHMIVT